MFRANKWVSIYQKAAKRQKREKGIFSTRQVKVPTEKIVRLTLFFQSLRSHKNGFDILGHKSKTFFARLYKEREKIVPSIFETDCFDNLDIAVKVSRWNIGFLKYWIYWMCRRGRNLMIFLNFNSFCFGKREGGSRGACHHLRAASHST